MCLHTVGLRRQSRLEVIEVAVPCAFCRLVELELDATFLSGMVDLENKLYLETHLNDSSSDMPIF
jgi:hypothetical protein